MTFNNAPSSIDGAQLTSALVRRGTFASSSGAEGVVLRDDLKVTQLAVPGIGVLISAGVGLALNKYQGATPNETYVVSNPSTHTIPSIEMPASNPSPKSYIVAVVVGDPDFSQTGHPWMAPSDPPLGQELTFQYVRPTLIEVSPGATTLAGNFPGLVLARIDVPASTTTIINSYITDLRALANPRQSQQIFVSGSGVWNALTVYLDDGAAHVDWGTSQFLPQVKIPSWAKRAIMINTVNGIQILDTAINIGGKLRGQMGAVTGPLTVFDLPTATGAARINLQAAGEFDVTSIAGTTVNLNVEGYQDVPASPTSNQRLRLTTGSQMVFDVRFFEE